MVEFVKMERKTQFFSKSFHIWILRIFKIEGNSAVIKMNFV